MSLFKIKNLTAEVRKKGRGEVKAVGEALYLPPISRKELETAIGTVKMGQQICYITDGAWSMHELLAYLLKQTGRAKVYIVTWTITEVPARSLLMLKKDNLISELHCVIDDRVRSRTPKSFQLLEQTCDRLLEKKCHSKNIIIENEEWQIGVISTANFSKNPRIESGVIDCNRQTAEFFRQFIDTLWN